MTDITSLVNHAVAVSALDHALDAMNALSPQVSSHGLIFLRARAEHDLRIDRIKRVRDELASIYENMAEEAPKE